jgi:hypothetical protein
MSGEDITKCTKYTNFPPTAPSDPEIPIQTKNNRPHLFDNLQFLLFLRKFFTYDYKVPEFKNALLVIVFPVYRFIRLCRCSPVRIPDPYIALRLHVPGAGYGHHITFQYFFIKRNATYLR